MAEWCDMARILVINPNCSGDCSAGIEAAIAPFRFAGGPVLEVATLAEGPPAIYSWRDWHSVVEPMCRLIEREPADAYVIACASDPGIEAARAVTRRPVFGVFRSAVAAAVSRAERFGVIAIVEASKARHLLALRAMGLADRLAAEVALNVTMETLLDPDLARERLIAAGRELVAAGAGAVVLGCTGMAHHRAALADAVGLPVIEPCQAGVLMAIGAVGGG
ncbi:MAG: aspartate/glutamate racemase family protein [Acetobacteraceae bacterium]|jgi:Asp/Glu/hydantoin racemase